MSQTLNATPRQSALALEIKQLRARQRFWLFCLLAGLGTVLIGLHILDDGLALGWLTWICLGILAVIMGSRAAKSCAHLFWFSDLNRINHRPKSADMVILSLLTIPPLITVAEKLATDWLSGALIIFAAMIYLISAVKAYRHFAD